MSDKTVWYWREPTGLYLVSLRDGTEFEDDNELETRVGGRSPAKARKLAESLADRYGAEVRKA